MAGIAGGAIGEKWHGVVSYFESHVYFVVLLLFAGWEAVNSTTNMPFSYIGRCLQTSVVDLKRMMNLLLLYPARQRARCYGLTRQTQRLLR